MKRIISKRFLSLALAIIMVAALIPGSAFAAEGDASHVETYNLNYTALGKDANVNLSTVDDYGTHGWKFFGYTDGIQENDVKGARVGIVTSEDERGLHFYINKAAQQSGTFALSLKAPVADKKGFYIPSVHWYCTNNPQTLSWFISKPVEGKESVSDYAKNGEHVLDVSKKRDEYELTHSATKVIYVSGGEDLISAMKLEAKNYAFYSISLTQILPTAIKTSVNNVSSISFDLADGDTSNDTATAETKVTGKTVVDSTETPITDMPVSNSFVTYHCEDDNPDADVVTVDENTGVITAVAAGTAEVWAQTPDGAVSSTPITVTVTAPAEEPDEPETVSGNVSFGAYSDVAGSVTVMVDGDASDKVIDSIPIGSTVKAVANTTNPNYKFLGWKRGSADHGVWLTTDAKVEFPIMTHTFLTAVYEPVADDAAVNVEFYNYKGQYLDTAENVGNTAFSAITKPEPTLTGYSNPFWTLDGVNAIADNTIFTKLTRIVAKYSSTDSFAVTIDSETIKGATSNTYAYDTELELESVLGNAGTWYVGDKPVAYGVSYKHCVWDEASITFVAEKTTAPIISIDDKVKDNGARMISYDANGKDIVEVGILFGDNAVVTSFGSKAASKATGNVQGQFTAMPNSGNSATARGYLIYSDGTEYKVIYSK